MIEWHRNIGLSLVYVALTPSVTLFYRAFTNFKFLQTNALGYNLKKDLNFCKSVPMLVGPFLI